MKQKVVYFFNNENYTDYHELAKAMAANWNEALVHIGNGISLNYFIKNDPYVYGKMNVEFKRCKYLDNVLTLFLNTIAPELGVCIKGKFFRSVVELAQYMNKQYTTVVPGIKAFFEDKGLTRLFMNEILAYEGGPSEFTDLIPYIEANADDTFTYYYFFKHFVKGKDERYDLNLYLNHIINQSNSIQALYDVTRRDDFLYAMSRMIGFENTNRYRQNPDFLFGLYDLIGKYVDVDFMKLAYNGYHIHMLANFKNYNFGNKTSKDIYGQYIKLSTRYAKAKDLDIEFARRVYGLYLRLVDSYKNNDVTTSNLRYAIDKVCCNTLCCLAYDAEAQTAPVVEQPKPQVQVQPQVKEPEVPIPSIPVENEPVQPQNLVVNNNDIITDDMFDVAAPDFANANDEPVKQEQPVNQNYNPNGNGSPIYIVVNGTTQQVTQDIPSEPDFARNVQETPAPAPVEEQLDEEGKPLTDAARKMKKFKGTYGRKTRFAVFTFLLGAWFIAEFVLSLLVRKKAIINTEFDYGVVACGGVTVLASIILLFRNAKSKRLSKKYYDENGNRTEAANDLTKLDRRKLRKKIYYSFRAWSTIIIVCVSFALICVLWQYLKPIVETLDIEFVKNMLTVWNDYYLLIAPVLGLLLCVVKKKKTIPYALFCWILEIVVVFGALAIASLL